METRDILIYLSLLYKGEHKRISQALRQRLVVDLEEASRAVSSLSCHAVTYLDKCYPACLRRITDSPYVLFYQGNLELLSEETKCITMVGSRETSAYALGETKRLAGDLASQGFVIVSGLARGIDVASHQGALPFGKTIAILGNGIDVYYPSEHEDIQKEIARNGLLISEYPPGTPPDAWHFPTRNRLLAAVSRATLCMDALPHSGSMITLAFALHYGKDIGCLPQLSTRQSINNLLIKEGAWMIESAEDVYNMLGYNPAQLV